MGGGSQILPIFAGGGPDLANNEFSEGASIIW